MAKYISDQWSGPTKGKFVLLDSPAVVVTKHNGTTAMLDYPANAQRIELLAAYPSIWDCRLKRREGWQSKFDEVCDDGPPWIQAERAASRERVMWYGPILTSKRDTAITRIKGMGSSITWGKPEAGHERRFLGWAQIAAIPILPSYRKIGWPWAWPFKTTKAWFDPNPSKLPLFRITGAETWVPEARMWVPSAGKLIASSERQSLTFVAGAVPTAYLEFPVLQR